MDKHLSTQFDTELSTVSTRVLEMGGLAESQVNRAVYALTHLNGEVASEVLHDEDRINRMEVEIDGELSTIIARRQPTARDLRLLIAISKTIGNLERVGDEAARIARTVQRLINAGVSSRMRVPIDDLSYESTLATESLRRALDAFARLDVNQALQVLRRDNEIDVEFEVGDGCLQPVQVGGLVRQGGLIELDIALLDRRSQDHLPTNPNSGRFGSCGERRHSYVEIAVGLHQTPQSPTSGDLSLTERTTVVAGHCDLGARLGQHLHLALAARAVATTSGVDRDPVPRRRIEDGHPGRHPHTLGATDRALGVE